MKELFLIIFASIFLFYFSNIISKKFNLLDFPNKRKIHFEPIPFTGGLGLILSFFFTIWVLHVDYILLNVIFSSFLILCLGVLDDKYKINIGTRIFFQILIIFFFINTYHIEINYIFKIDNSFKLSLGGFSLIFTLLSVVFFINACNYLDGIDGLLTIQTITIFLFFSFLQFYIHNIINTDLLYLIIPMIVFLFFNFKTFSLPKLFLGNGGSTMLGFNIAFFSIYYGYFYKYLIDPELLIWCLTVVVYEFLSTNLSRFIKNKPLFNPGQDHIQYILLKKYNSVLKANIIISISNVFLLGIGLLSWNFGEIYSVLAYILFFFIYFKIRDKLSKTTIQDN